MMEIFGQDTLSCGKQNINCDRVKMVLMLMIVISHCLCVFRTVGWGEYHVANPSIIADYINGYSDFITYAFCFVSGYLFYLNKLENGKYRNVPSALLHRAKRLLVPYFLVMSLWCYPVGGALNQYDFSLQSYYEKVILGKGAGQLWFLMMLFTVFTIFLFLGEIPTRINCIIGVLFFTAIGFLADRFYSKLSPFDCVQLRTALRYSFSYYLGLLYYKYPIRINPLVSVITSITSFLLYFHIKSIGYFPYRDYIIYGFKVIFICAGILMIISIDSYMGGINICREKVKIFLEKNNFGIYLVHQQLIEISIVLIGGVVSNLVLFASNLFFAFAGSLAMIWIYSSIKRCYEKYTGRSLD